MHFLDAMIFKYFSLPSASNNEKEPKKVRRIKIRLNHHFWRGMLFCPPHQELLEYGANPDISQLRIGYFNSTPVYIAIAYHNFECFRTLLLGGADPEGGSGSTSLPPDNSLPPCPSLYHAVVKHNVEIDYVRWLYDCGASLYHRDARGRLACDDGPGVPNECSRYIRQLMGACDFVLFSSKTWTGEWLARITKQQ